MKIFRASLRSVTPYSQSRSYDRFVPKKDKEGADAYEERTWRERCHALEPDGRIFIPPMSFKMCLDDAAKHIGMKIPGRRNKTYTQSFVSGVLVPRGPELPITKDEVQGEWLFLNSDGVRGSGKRVWRCMPKIPEWAADIDFHVFDETITEEVFAYHLKQAGSFIGIGRFRPQKGGFYGRFVVDRIAALEA